MDAPDSTSSASGTVASSSAAQITRTREILGLIVARAKGIIRIARGMALAEMAAALVLWLALAKPLEAGSAGLVAGFALLCVLLVPGAILWMFYAGLAGIASLPEAIIEMARDGGVQRTQILSAARGVASRPGLKSGWNVIRSVLELRSYALRARTVLLGMGVVLKLRFLNPVFLALVFVSIASSVVIIALAILAIIAALL